MIYTITLNPALDKTVSIPDFSIDTVNRIQTLRTDAGGKGINVSKVIHSLGAVSTAAGILGGSTGQAILEALKKLGIETFFHFIPGETRTNLKVIDPSRHTNTDINEPGPPVQLDDLAGLLSALLARVSAGDIAVISGSLPAGAPADTYFTWTRALRERGVRVILDADGEPLSRAVQASPHLMKPNIHELSALTGRPLRTAAQAREAAVPLMEAYRIPKAVISMGGEGALYLLEGRALYARAVPVPVHSTVGAGDSMAAALAVAEEAGMALADTIRLSMAAGAASVMESGSQAAAYDTIKRLIPLVRFEEMH